MQTFGHAKLPDQSPVVAIEAVFGSHPQVSLAVLRDAVDVEVAKALGNGVEGKLLAEAGGRSQCQRDQAAHTALHNAQQPPQHFAQMRTLLAGMSSLYTRRAGADRCEIEGRIGVLTGQFP
jgi:hypothetical protein